MHTHTHTHTLPPPLHPCVPHLHNCLSFFTFVYTKINHKRSSTDYGVPQLLAQQAEFTPSSGLQRAKIELLRGATFAVVEVPQLSGIFFMQLGTMLRKPFHSPINLGGLTHFFLSKLKC